MDKPISEEELQQHDGQQGRPAYVAYQGKVYDVSASKLWRQGTHVRRHHAGNDLSDSLEAAPHGEEVFEQVPLVGHLAEAEKTAVREAPPLIDWLLNQHPHPLAVHFPVAFVTGAAIFLALYLITKTASLERCAYGMVWSGVGMAPITALTGATSWWYNYQGKLTGKFKGKISLSTTLMVLGGIALGLRTANPDALVQGDPVGWVYLGLVALMLVAVGGLGWIGGKIAWG